MDGRPLDLPRLCGWIAGCISVLLVAYVLFPVYACACSTKQGAKRTMVISNVKQNGTALMIYAADWDGLLPPANVWATASKKYRKNDDLLRDITLPTKSDYGFAFYSPAGMVNPELIETPELVPLIFQTDVLKMDANGTLSLLPAKPRADGKDIIGRADSSVKLTERGTALSPVRLKPNK
jgi:hypothetical protein